MLSFSVSQTGVGGFAFPSWEEKRPELELVEVEWGRGCILSQFLDGSRAPGPNLQEWVAGISVIPNTHHPTITLQLLVPPLLGELCLERRGETAGIPIGFSGRLSWG